MALYKTLLLILGMVLLVAATSLGCGRRPSGGKTPEANATAIFTPTPTSAPTAISTPPNMTQAVVTPEPLDHVIVSPSNPSEQVDSVQKFTAQGYDAKGDVIDGLTYIWSASATAGSIDRSTGVFTSGHTAGIYPDAVQVVSGSVSSSDSVTVTPGSLDHIVVSPLNASVIVNGTQKFTAQGYDKYGNAIKGLTYTWSANATAGSIDSFTGVFTAGSVAGSYTDVIEANSGSISSSTGIKVTPPLFSKPNQLTMLSITEGDILIMTAHSTSWVKAEVGMTLEPDDILKTSANSWAQITFFEGSTVELEPGTQVSIVELSIATDTGSTAIGLKQQIGRTVSRVKKLADLASTYQIETPTGVAAVRGSTMLLDVTEDGTSAVGNVEGTIAAIAQGINVQITAGMQSIIGINEPPSPPISGLPFVPSNGVLGGGYYVGKFANSL